MDSHAAIAHENFIEAWKVLCAALSDGIVQTEDGLTLFASGLSSPFFNVAAVTAPGNPRDTLERCRDFFRRRSLPFSFRIPMEYSGGFAELADSFNLVGERTIPAMVMPEIPSPLPPTPPGLAISDITDERIDDYIEANAAGFETDLETFERLFREPLRRRPEFIGIAGERDGEMVATSAALLVGDAVGVYGVGTPPAHRRQGLGEALTWAAVERGAREGFTMATLQASDMGEPIYRRMGFVTVLEYLYFESA